MEKVRNSNTNVIVPTSNLWLIRHGQTDWNRTGRWQGQSPHAPALNEAGRMQALAVRDQLRGKRFSAIYSSDLLRSHQTAELLAEPLGLPVTLEPGLREMDLGSWEGMLSEEIQARFPQVLAERERDPFHTPAPGGESPLQVAKRVIPAVEKITLKHCGEPVLIVAHGISLAVILCHARGIPRNRLYEHIPDNAKLYQVNWIPARYAGEVRGAGNFVKLAL